jgi:hypothetical protein
MAHTSSVVGKRGSPIYGCRLADKLATSPASSQRIAAALDKRRPKACGPCNVPADWTLQSDSVDVPQCRTATLDHCWPSGPPSGSIPRRRNKSRNGICGAFEFPYEHAMVLPRYQYQDARRSSPRPSTLYHSLKAAFLIPLTIWHA